MKIIYTLHARIRMQERSISEHEVRETIFNPDQAISTFEGRKKYLRKHNSMMLEIVCIHEQNCVIVVTLYPLYYL